MILSTRDRSFQMRYKSTHVNADHYYSVGIDEETGEYLIEIVVTWVMWYSIYFRLLAEEVEAFQLDHNSLTPLSYELASDKGFVRFRDRLVLNEKPSRR
jgi:hypothetical protein